MKLVFKYLFFAFLIFTVYVLVSSTYLNSDYWLISFFGLFIPVLFTINFLFFTTWFFLKNNLLLAFSIAIFLLGYPALKKTFVYHSAVNDSPDIKVMSYNVGTFNLKRFNRIEDTINPKLMINWFKKNIDADVICLQEFYNNSISDVENTVDGITGIRKLYYFYTNPIFWNEVQGFFGVITFSRFPIVNSGPLIFGDSSINRGVYLDLKIKNDTVRIINIHLHSMTIRLDTTDTFFPVKVVTNSIDIIERLKKGITQRNKEIDVVTQFINASPFPVIVCGDFNDTPYSYTYQKVNKLLGNSFENAGTGFGFTYNRFPWFVRIDNQFHDRCFNPIAFKIYTDNKYSDHYPIQVGYKFK